VVIWSINTTTKIAYVLVDSTAGAAVWNAIAYAITYEIGDIGPAGGIVFYVTDDGLHGLEAATVDQSGDVAWCDVLTDISGTSTAIGAGQNNTDLIVADCPDPAAKFANAYVLNGYNDWFLPSKDELNKLYLQKDVVGGFTSVGYWSSSQSQTDSDDAEFQTFGGGSQFPVGKEFTNRVRAVREF
jgi:hypothetical protein